MSFLSSQDKNPDYLNFYLKYIRYISLYAETTVNKIYNDIRIFFRYLIIRHFAYFSLCVLYKITK